MRTILADLHIHTALSPCASDEMTPAGIVAAAVDNGLGMIAVCDHNSAGNAAAVMAAAERQRHAGGAFAADLGVIAGMEITTAEEVHVLGLFPTVVAALAAGEQVGETLPPADESYYERFGEQNLMDADGAIVGHEGRMLAAATTLSLTAAVELVHRHGGIAVAAHVNRPSFSVLSQLGVFPMDAGFDAIEVFAPCGAVGEGGPSPRGPSLEALAEYARYGLPLMSSSDSHYPGDVGKARSVVRVREPNFDELALALRGQDGRGVRCA